MPRYNEYVVEKVAKAIYESAWDRKWEDALSIHRDDYLTMAHAALIAIDSLYESEAEEPVEYAGIEGGL